MNVLMKLQSINTAQHIAQWLWQATSSTSGIDRLIDSALVSSGANDLATSTSFHRAQNGSHSAPFCSVHGSYLHVNPLTHSLSTNLNAISNSDRQTSLFWLQSRKNYEPSLRLLMTLDDSLASPSTFSSPVTITTADCYSCKVAKINRRIRLLNEPSVDFLWSRKLRQSGCGRGSFGPLICHLLIKSASGSPCSDAA